jgi:hypothetical protein
MVRSRRCQFDVVTECIDLLHCKGALLCEFGIARSIC